MKKEDLPINIPVFPLSNFIIFPKTTVPLNIFEPRYIDMINDSMKSNKIIGMIQPQSSSYQKVQPELHKVGCIGKITSFPIAVIYPTIDNLPRHPSQRKQGNGRQHCKMQSLRANRSNAHLKNAPSI